MRVRGQTFFSSLGTLSILISLSLQSSLVFAQGSSSSSIETKKESGPRWGLSYFNFSTSDASISNYNLASWNIYQYFSINYILNKNERFTFRPSFIVQTSGVMDNFGNSRGFTSFPSDFHMTYSNYELKRWNSDLNFSGTFYLYLPTTEFSQNKKWAARTSAWLILDNQISTKWKLSYNMKPDYYWLTQKSYRNEKVKTLANGGTSTDVYPDANMIGKLDHYAELTYSVSDNFSPGLAVGLIHEWYADSQWTTNKLNTDRFKFSPNVFFRVHPQLAFITGVENKIDIRDPKKSFSLFREEENQYYVMTFWTLL